MTKQYIKRLAKFIKDMEQTANPKHMQREVVIYYNPATKVLNFITNAELFNYERISIAIPANEFF